ncbi:NADPH-dependent oxidoreductase [Fusibacter sp. JL298sf-3]
MKDIYEVMMNHKSIRKYKEEPVPQKDLKKILNAAIHGPTSINGQQFSILVVKDQAKKDKIAELAGGQPWIAQAPVFLIFLADYHRVAETMKRDGLAVENMDSIEATMVGSVDCGIAFGNAMTMAESMGYGIVPIGAIRREPYEIIEMLELPKYVYPVVGMCVGLPDESPMLKPRFPYEVMVHEETYAADVKAAIEAYDQVVTDYMNERTQGADVRTWSQTVSGVYKQVYFPKVKGSLEKQGYTNEK